MRLSLNKRDINKLREIYAKKYKEGDKLFDEIYSDLISISLLKTKVKKKKLLPVTRSVMFCFIKAWRDCFGNLRMVGNSLVIAKKAIEILKTPQKIDEFIDWAVNERKAELRVYGFGKLLTDYEKRMQDM